MVFLTLVPITRNDGTPVPDDELQRIVERIGLQFGGATVEGPVRGMWIDPADGTRYDDACLKVTVSCDPERLAEAEALIREIGRQLGQKAMYFEVRYFDGVRILRIDEG